MRPEDFSKENQEHVTHALGGYPAFVPPPLPPAIEPSWRLLNVLSEADRAISELAGKARNLPNPNLLVSSFIRREAVLSSRIEGTQTSYPDLLLHEVAESAPPPPGRTTPDDAREVSNYVWALEYGLSRLESLPISLRLIREIHARLMEGARGGEEKPGEFRRTQNWIGPPGCRLKEATYVPPPPPQMHESLDRLEKFIHSESHFPPLIKQALVHYQFEAIHPFRDGNGRVGRLLISLMLCSDGILTKPLLYLSAYFEKNRNDYYRLLLEVSQRSSWGRWIEFFLTGVREQSHDALWRTDRLLTLWVDYRGRVISARSSSLLLQMVDDLFTSPVTTIPGTARRLKITQRSASLNIQRLVEAGVLTEVSGRQRYRIYMCQGIIEAIDQPRPVQPE